MGAPISGPDVDGLMEYDRAGLLFRLSTVTWMAGRSGVPCLATQTRAMSTFSEPALL